jgi:hypothetical protein
MLRRSCPVVAGLALFACLAVVARPVPVRAMPNLDDLVIRAVSADPEQSARAIAALRDVGPTGLEWLVRAHADALARGPDGSDAWRRLAAAVDGVAAQRDAHASRLYWYTDLEKAKAAAARDGKPILSLRLLGTLDAELSCANSRFFRTTLYPDPAVRALLRERFVLHWQSVRPVPVVTIDFGDGRTIRRTVTGNSAHLVLDPAGRPVDVIPGLYAAPAFVRALNEALAIASDVRDAGDQQRAEILASRHRAALERTATAWQDDLRRAGLANATPAPDAPAQPAAARRQVPAREAARLAITKSFQEAPLLTALPIERAAPTPASADDATWAAIAALRADEARLSPEVEAVVATKVTASHPTAAQAAALAMSKTRVESPLVRLVANLQRTIAGDTVRNEYALHRRAHEWFASAEVGDDPNALTDRVYAELFLTPNTDPWLGLAPADVFTAIGEGADVP